VSTTDLKHLRIQILKIIKGELEPQSLNLNACLPPLPNCIRIKVKGAQNLGWLIQHMPH